MPPFRGHWLQTKRGRRGTPPGHNSHILLNFMSISVGDLPSPLLCCHPLLAPRQGSDQTPVILWVLAPRLRATKIRSLSPITLLPLVSQCLYSVRRTSLFPAVRSGDSAHTSPCLRRKQWLLLVTLAVGCPSVTARRQSPALKDCPA